jgi:hypothetical protein
MPNAAQREKNAAALNFLDGAVASPAGDVPRAKTVLDWRDCRGAIRVRLNIGRMRYAVRPGLYAVGDPGKDSPVLASANYKLSFDALRRELSGIDAWILVLDTKGVNVWCAAGKGTFGTHEIVKRIGETGLDGVVGHRLIILPQLGAPGVAAHAVFAMSGFRVQYGPVRASDLPEYLAAGRKKTDAMRRVEFSFADRLKLAPLELAQAWPFLLVSCIAAIGLDILHRRALAPASAIACLPYAYACLAGSLLTPAFLPWLPFRAFSLKGALAGAAGLGAWWALAAWPPLNGLGIMLTALPLSAFLALNFTGASTYTSLSGVKREMKFAMPVIIAAEVLGIALRVALAVLGV